MRYMTVKQVREFLQTIPAYKESLKKGFPIEVGDTFPGYAITIVEEGDERLNASTM